MPRTATASRALKFVDWGVTKLAGLTYNTVQFFNGRIKPNPSFTPKWSDKPILKSWEKTKPTLGFPRTTDSLCPKCVAEARTSGRGSRCR